MDVKKVLKSFWEDTCTVIEYEEYLRENNSTGQKEIVVLENEPCRISFRTIRSAVETENASSLVQEVKLFIDNEIEIKAGSKIVVTRKNGKIYEYKQSGEAAVFTNHQEILLTLFKEFA